MQRYTSFYTQKSLKNKKTREAKDIQGYKRKEMPFQSPTRQRILKNNQGFNFVIHLLPDMGPGFSSLQSQ